MSDTATTTVTVGYGIFETSLLEPSFDNDASMIVSQPWCNDSVVTPKRGGAVGSHLGFPLFPTVGLLFAFMVSDNVIGDMVQEATFSSTFSNTSTTSQVASSFVIPHAISRKVGTIRVPAALPLRMSAVVGGWLDHPSPP